MLGHTMLYLIKGILLLQPEDVRLAEAHGDLMARRQMRRLSTHSLHREVGMRRTGKRTSTSPPTCDGASGVPG